MQRWQKPIIELLEMSMQLYLQWIYIFLHTWRKETVKNSLNKDTDTDKTAGMTDLKTELVMNEELTIEMLRFFKMSS